MGTAAIHLKANAALPVEKIGAPDRINSVASLPHPSGARFARLSADCVGLGSNLYLLPSEG